MEESEKIMIANEIIELLDKVKHRNNWENNQRKIEIVAIVLATLDRHYFIQRVDH